MIVLPLAPISFVVALIVFGLLCHNKIRDIQYTCAALMISIVTFFATYGFLEFVWLFLYGQQG